MIYWLANSTWSLQTDKLNREGGTGLYRNKNSSNNSNYACQLMK